MSESPDTLAPALVARASQITIGELFRAQARIRPTAVAVEEGGRQLSYRELNGRVNRLCQVLTAFGIHHGDRLALLSENRTEYLEVTLAAAKLGAIVCALNWRLAPPEQEHCIRLATPGLLIASPRYEDALTALDHGVDHTLVLGETYEEQLAAAEPHEPTTPVHPEDGLAILYTSGTTGLPKGALISHRAEIARLQGNTADLGMRAGAIFLAWAPMFHMASMDPSIGILCTGGTVVVYDGFDVTGLVRTLGERPIWWLILMPGTIEAFCAEMDRQGIRPQSVELVGAMADLVPLHQIVEITTRLNAPYLNSFGSTETGTPPASSGKLAAGVTPETLDKTPSPLCEIRLVDPDDNDVPDGTPGELAIRGPTLFSGYWNAPETNARDFRDGWFHMGDAFVRRPNGKLAFVDRVKYLIKSGGENIYPAEIERVLLAEPRVDEAVVIRVPDAHWGEVPVAMVARRDDSLTAQELHRLCRQSLAGYKQPKAIHFLALDDFPRSTTGKVQRHELEAKVPSTTGN